MPIYRPETRMISQDSNDSGISLDKDVTMSTMFTQASVSTNIAISISGESRSLPIIYASETPSGTTTSVTIKKQ